MKKLLAALTLLASAAYASSTRTGQATVLTASAVLIGDNSARVTLSILNGDASNPIYCGPSSTVSSTTGLKIPAGAGYTWDGGPADYSMNPVARQAFYCIATGSSVTASYLENASQ